MKNITFKDMFVKGAVIFNPVLVQLVGLCPVVAASTSLSSSVMLSVALCAELIVTCVIASALFKKIPRWVRVTLYLLIGLCLICPVLRYIETYTLINLSLGMKIYIPLIAINSVTAVHCEQFAVKNNVKLAFYDAAAVGIGGSIICIAVGAIREIFGSGSLAGVAIDLPIIFRGMTLPFGCLILLGFLSAGLKAFVDRKQPHYIEQEEPEQEPEEAPTEEQSEVTEVEVFDEFWAEQEEPAPAPEPIPEPAPVEENEDIDIDALFKSLGLDVEEGEKK